MMHMKDSLQGSYVFCICVMLKDVSFPSPIAFFVSHPSTSFFFQTYFCDFVVTCLIDNFFVCLL